MVCLKSFLYSRAEQLYKTLGMVYHEGFPNVSILNVKKGLRHLHVIIERSLHTAIIVKVYTIRVWHSVTKGLVLTVQIWQLALLAVSQAVSVVSRKAGCLLLNTILKIYFRIRFNHSKAEGGNENQTK